MAVVPLSRIPPGALAHVLAAQQDEWLERLDWNLTEITEQLEEWIGTRVLRGSVLLEGDEPVGYGFFSPEAGRCLIGDIYVLPSHRTPAASRLLAGEMLQQVLRSYGRKRLESQSVHFDTRGLEEAFAENGFTREGRCYLTADLRGGRVLSQPTEHPRVRIRPWVESDYAAVHEIIYESYRGTVDARANSGYRTREGCADLLEALTDSAWCGRFDSQLTQVAIDRETGRCCGVAIASRISRTAAHLGQISVLPIYQGEGIGRALVERALEAAKASALARVTLAVTRANERAARLYENCGFRPHLSFPVFFRDPQTNH